MKLDLEDVGLFGGVKVMNTKVKHARHKVAGVDKRGWDGLRWHQCIGRGINHEG